MAASGHFILFVGILGVATSLGQASDDDVPQCSMESPETCEQQASVSLLQHSFESKKINAHTGPGCGCSALRVLYHRHASEKHIMCLKNTSYPACRLYAKNYDKGFQEDTAAGNRYYVDSCNYTIDKSCKVGYHEALYYKYKLAEVDGMETPDKREITPYWQNMLDELDNVLNRGNVGCSCTPPSIYMYRIWKGSGIVGGEGNINDSDGFFSQPAIAALNACNDTVDASCLYDPVEAQFHAIGYKAHKRVYDLGIETSAPWTGHLEFVKTASGMPAVNEQRLKELKEIIRKEAADPNWKGAPEVH